MDFRLSSEERQFQSEVVEFMSKEATPSLIEEVDSGTVSGPRTMEFIRKLGRKRWLAPALPPEYGGLGASYMFRFIVTDEMHYFLPHLTRMFTGAQVVAPIVMQVGNEGQKKEYLPRIARGEIEFALGYTEPEAGSDLANVSIKVSERDGRYVIDGEKMFNTAMHYAQYVWLCARTATTDPKHKGLSLFIVPTDAPGLSFSPMWTVAEERTNMVFYDNVVVPKENLVGEKNRGFYHMAAALEHERIFPIGKVRRALDDLIKYVNSTWREGRLLGDDPIVRQKLADLAIQVETARWLAYRLVWLVENHKPNDYESAVSKLFLTELEQKVSQVGLSIMGQQGVVTSRSKYADPIVGWMEQWFRSTPKRTITAGSSEIQRNIIAQRGLGLPRT